MSSAIQEAVLALSYYVQDLFVGSLEVAENDSLQTWIGNGATLFYIYVHSISEEVDLMLKMYEAQRDIEVRSVKDIFFRDFIAGVDSKDSTFRTKVDEKRHVNLILSEMTRNERDVEALAVKQGVKFAEV